MHGNDREKKWYVLPLVLYAAIMYNSACWFLFPFFLASCFYALWVRCLSCSSDQFFSFSFKALFVWSFLAAFILIFPCLVVLLEFYSLAATCGAFLLLAYTVLSIFILLTVLIGSGNIFTTPFLMVVGWSGIFVAWWWFVDTFFFISVGVPCGYVIANPIVCCAAAPNSCVLVPYIGMYSLLALWLIAAGGSVLWLVSGSRACGILVLVVGVVFGAGFASRELTERSTHLFLSLKNILSTQQLPAGILFANSKLNGESGTSEPWKSIFAFKLSGHEAGVLEIAAKLQRQFLACSSQVVIPNFIVGPESCLPCVLNSEPSLYAFFDNTGSCVSTQVLLGARRQEDKKCFNSAFIMRQGRIIFSYDKLFPLPFLETGSSSSWMFFLRGFSFSKQKVVGKTPYSVGTRTGGVTLSLGGSEYHAHIALCSDFFCTTLFSSKRLFLKKNPLLIVLTHDSWFYGTSVADRMHRYAVLWAVGHQVPVLYVGNHYSSWIEPSGHVWSLATVDS